METYLFNYVLVGSDLNVGVNTIISNILNNNNDKNDNDSDNNNNDCKSIKIGNKIIKQLITDSKSYDQLSPDYGRVQAFFIVFDLTNKQSYLNLDKIINDVSKKSWGDSLFILVGNKCDIKDQRQVTYDEIKEYSNKINSKYFEVSAKDNNGINDIESMFYYASLINIIKKNDESGINKSINDFDFYKDKVTKVKYLIYGDNSVGKSKLNSFIINNSNSIIDDEPGYINSFIMDIDNNNNNKVAIKSIIHNNDNDSLSFNADAIIMVIDISNKSSLDYIQQHYQDILNRYNNKKVLLIGNKNDLIDQQQISSDEAKSFANEKLNCNYIETSFTKDFTITTFNQILFDFTKEVSKIIQINTQLKSIKKKKSQQKKDCIIC